MKLTNMKIGFSSKNIMNFTESENETAIRNCLKSFFSFNQLIKIFEIYEEDLNLFINTDKTMYKS